MGFVSIVYKILAEKFSYDIPTCALSDTSAMRNTHDNNSAIENKIISSQDLIITQIITQINY